MNVFQLGECLKLYENFILNDEVGPPRTNGNRDVFIKDVLFDFTFEGQSEST
jgi:hypothetical protein